MKTLLLLFALVLVSCDTPMSFPDTESDDVANIRMTAIEKRMDALKMELDALQSVINSQQKVLGSLAGAVEIGTRVDEASLKTIQNLTANQIALTGKLSDLYDAFNSQ